MLIRIFFLTYTKNELSLQLLMSRECKIVSIQAVEGGAVLVYRFCEEEDVVLYVKKALQSEGFAFSDGTDKHGVYKLKQDSLLAKFSSEGIVFKLDIIANGDFIQAHLEDVTPRLDYQSPKRIHLRNIRRIIAFLENLDKSED